MADSCKHPKYATSISAQKALAALGLPARGRDVVKCWSCGKWRIREGVV